MKERLRFRCPCCGMIADVDRLNGEGPYELELFIQRFGGKVKLTEDEWKDRKDKPFRRGSARGFIEYEKIEVSPQIYEFMRKRTDEVRGQLNSEVA